MVQYAASDGSSKTLECDRLIVSIGRSANTEGLNAEGVGLKLERGFIAVDGDCRTGVPGVWAIGDVAAFLDPKTGKRVPALAQATTKEASVVAENVTRRLERKRPMAFHPPSHWVTAIPLGGAYGLVDFGSWSLRGRLGYFVRKAADFFYFFSILPFGQAFRMWLKGTNVYIKND